MINNYLVNVNVSFSFFAIKVENICNRSQIQNILKGDEMRWQEIALSKSSVELAFSEIRAQNCR